MKVFTLICALLVIATGAAEFYGWGGEEDGPRTILSAIPAFFGAAMLLGTLLAIFFRRTGLQIAFLAALAGGFAGLGRLAPPYLKETLILNSYPNQLILGMCGVCLVYVLVAAFCYLFVRRNPVEESLVDDAVSSRQEESVGIVEDKEDGQDQDQEMGEDGARDPEKPEEEKESESSSVPVS